MARTSLTSGSATANAPKFTTNSVAPHENALILLYVTSAAPLVGPTPPVPTISGNGLVWVVVNTAVFGTGNRRRLSCFRAMGTPISGGITIDFGGQSQDFCAWSVFEFDDVDTSGTSGASALRQAVKATASGSSLTANLAAGAAGNVSAGGMALDAPQSVTSGAGFTEIHEQVITQPLGQGGALETQDATTVVSAVAWKWGTTANAAAIAVEVNAAPTTPPTPPSNDEQLIRRFEPVLFLHPQEEFFPVDAKRYIEHAALWSATALFDNKNNWQRVVAPGDLAASDTEPGTYLGDVLGSDDERFLELGGWKDKSGSAEPDVSPSTTNLYANRDAIVDAYRGDDLALSQFWYHGEVFPTDRLRGLAGGPPDLGKTLDNLGLDNPTLLCYYLFFPAHVQSVGAGTCPGVDAVEVSCHPGDWQCIVLLLDGDGSGEASGFTPKYFGITGIRPAQMDIDGAPTYRPHQFDADELTAIKVEKWRSDSGPVAFQPELSGDHPRFFVANGSHSLYTTPGEQDVDPYPADKQPRGCGGYDDPSLTPPDTPGGEISTAQWLAIIAKLVTFGFPLNIVVGWGAAILEMINAEPPFGTGDSGNDTPDPDQPPTSVAQSVMVHPADVSDPEALGRVEPWRSQQGLLLNDRTYDFVVDRNAQVWWPNDDHERGFRGRWGQRVSTDPLSRRCGPKFPDYVNMFLSALEDGITRGFFTRQ